MKESLKAVALLEAREMLKQKDRQFDELRTRCFNLTAALIHEKTRGLAAERRVAELEGEMPRCECLGCPVHGARDRED